MPESVLTPAPVSTATVRPRSNSTACCTSASRRASRSVLATVLPGVAITEPPPAAARLNNSVFRYVSDGWQREAPTMHIVPISDPADARLRDYIGLTDVSLRRLTEPQEGLYIAESTKVIERALAAGHLPRSVLVQ